MKKIWILLPLISLLACNKDIIVPQSDLEKNGLSGDVVCITSIETESTDGQDLQEVFVKRAVTHYNEFGNKIDEIWYAQDSSIIRRFEYFYNSNNEKITEKYFESDGQLFLETSYEYKKGKLVSSVCKYADGTIESKYQYEYNRYNLLSKKIFLDGNDNIQGTHTYQYDSKGNITEDKWEHIQYMDYNWHLYYEYDENNFLVADRMYDGKNAPTYTSEYQYITDKNNNWIQKIETRDGIPSCLTLRLIEYK